MGGVLAAHITATYKISEHNCNSDTGHICQDMSGRFITVVNMFLLRAHREREHCIIHIVTVCVKCIIIDQGISFCPSYTCVTYVPSNQRDSLCRRK